MQARTQSRTEISRRRVAPRARSMRPPARSGADRLLVYRGGLDGLRSLAVAAIVLGHAGHGWMRGGDAVGMEIFFVLSGYLTMSLLLGEPPARAGDLVRFWGRRARRVLPALLTVLGGVSLLVLTIRPDELSRLGPEIRATLVGASNWHVILRALTQDHAAPPSFLEHLWPVAVGAQWTVIASLLALSGRSRRGRARLRLLALGGVAASAVAMGVLATMSWAPERVLYGTDTRAGGLLVGMALALAVRPASDGVVASGSRGRRLHVLGLCALAALTAAMIRGVAPEVLTHGGYLLVDVAVAIVIAVIVRGAALDRMLGAVPLRWLGLRALPAYLWHWPVLLTLGGPSTVRTPLASALYVGLTLVLADLTYRYVEVPLARVHPVPGSGRVGQASLAVRTTAIACGSASVVALLTGPAQV